MKESSLKADRMLSIYLRLSKGQILTKEALAQQFGVDKRSIQRDIDSLRCFLEEKNTQQEIVYDRNQKGYRLEDASNAFLRNSEILAVCKILLDSRSMRKDEMMPILDKLMDCCVRATDRKAVKQMILNETFHYVEPHHQKHLLNGLWEIEQAIQQQKVIQIEYERIKDHKTVKRVVEPVGIMFSEYYFYLTAFLRNINRKEEFENAEDVFPTIYRLDRITAFQLTDEHFYVPYKDRFEEGEFRRRVQFMYGGKLERVRFKYVGPSVEAVLDRLPTARIRSKDEEGWEIEAEVFGKGIEMWMRSQGDYIQQKK